MNLEKKLIEFLENPSDPEILCQLGSLYLHGNEVVNHPRANFYFQKAFTIKKSLTVDGYICLGLYSLKDHDYKKSAEFFRCAFETAPKHKHRFFQSYPGILCFLADYSFTNKDYQTAEDLFQAICCNCKGEVYEYAQNIRLTILYYNNEQLYPEYFIKYYEYCRDKYKLNAFTEEQLKMFVDCALAGNLEPDTISILKKIFFLDDNGDFVSPDKKEMDAQIAGILSEYYQDTQPEEALAWAESANRNVKDKDSGSIHGTNGKRNATSEEFIKGQILISCCSLTVSLAYLFAYKSIAASSFLKSLLFFLPVTAPVALVLWYAFRYKISPQILIRLFLVISGVFLVLYLFLLSSPGILRQCFVFGAAYLFLYIYLYRMRGKLNLLILTRNIH